MTKQEALKLARKLNKQHKHSRLHFWAGQHIMGHWVVGRTYLPIRLLNDRV